MINLTTSDRALRQRDLVPPVQLDLYHAFVVGVGAIGRQVAGGSATGGLGNPGFDLDR